MQVVRGITDKEQNSKKCFSVLHQPQPSGFGQNDHLGIRPPKSNKSVDFAVLEVACAFAAISTPRRKWEELRDESMEWITHVRNQIRGTKMFTR